MKTRTFLGPHTYAALRRTTASAFLLFTGSLSLASAAEEGTPRVSGRVVGDERPVSAAQVYAYDVATYALEKVTTDQKGKFLFEALPAGLYKIIAHKNGFVPAVELLLRRRPEAQQFLELQLVEEEAGDVRAAEGYWETRARIPADVLQQIRQLGLRERIPESGLEVAGADFKARMSARGGVSELGDEHGSAQVTDAEIGVSGTVGQTSILLDGRFLELAPSAEDAALPASELQALALSLFGADQSRLSVTASTGSVDEPEDGSMAPVDLKHYRLSWSGIAAGGASDFSAQLIDESNYYNAGLETSLELPDASRTLDIQGSYSRDLSASTSLTAGMSFRQRQGYRLLDPNGNLNDEVVGIYGVAGSQIQPRVLVEYGLYSTMREGGLSLMPHGGMVVRVGSAWQARTSIAQRVDSPEGEALYERFSSASFDDENTCRQSGEACYEVMFNRGEEGEDKLAVGAIHREFAETLRLYFSDDFFNRLESLFVVPGDELPELKFRMERRISPKILAKLESNFAKGGGGIFYATDDQAYQNQVRYLVTSLDTRFQRTSTGVFLAFHHLEQELNPLSSDDPNPASELEIQRLQLMLTQDLSALADIAPSLALRLNMEVSRGATPYTLKNDNEFYKKLVGGISFSF